MHFLAVQVATMGTRRKLSVSVNNCGVCGGVLKVRGHIHASVSLSMQQYAHVQSLHCNSLGIAILPEQH